MIQSEIQTSGISQTPPSKFFFFHFGLSLAWKAALVFANPPKPRREGLPRDLRILEAFIAWLRSWKEDHWESGREVLSFGRFWVENAGRMSCFFSF